MARNVGILSDTHGLLRDEVKSRLSGQDLIIHAGDIGSPGVLAELKQLAPVVAVRGNVDTGAWAQELAQEEYVSVDGWTICVVHDLCTLRLDAVAAGVDVVIHGHSHQPGIARKDGILYLNPGSAGPKRFHLPVAMALASIEGETFAPQIITVEA
ncbi:MAG: metallophosphatase family protein [Planctomycetes bacterium]|jgi:hypothetical protein|nr:metallophosphatase family protein [Planctomycetota bacterium]